jgi:hypothetical protein
MATTFSGGRVSLIESNSDQNHFSTARMQPPDTRSFAYGFSANKDWIALSQYYPPPPTDFRLDINSDTNVRPRTTGSLFSIRPGVAISRVAHKGSAWFLEIGTTEPLKQVFAFVTVDLPTQIPHRLASCASGKREDRIPNGSRELLFR